MEYTEMLYSKCEWGDPLNNSWNCQIWRIKYKLFLINLCTLISSILENNISESWILIRLLKGSKM